MQKSFKRLTETLLEKSQTVLSATRRRRNCGHFNPACVALSENLESRQMLSGHSLMLSDGVLKFHGQMMTAENVTLDHSADGTKLLATIQIAGQRMTHEFETADVTQFRFLGREMTDSLANNTELPTEVFMSHGEHHGRMLREMEAMFDLVRYGDVTRTAVQDGGWLNPDTWGGAENMPVDGDRVLIPEGTVVTVNGIVDVGLMTVRVDGTLRFAANRDSELRVDTMVVGMNGTLKMGTTFQPIADGVTARLVIEDYNGGFETSDTSSPDYDPFQLGNGLISHGRVSIVGAEKTSHATLSVEPSAGDSQLTFDSLPANWNVGDELVIAGTTSDALGDETRSIIAIHAATNSVTLNAALDKDHHAPAHTRDGLELKVHVGNVTRNAIIETAEQHRGATGTVRVPKGDTPSNLTGAAFAGRGHVMFMHNNDVEIANGGFYHLGRTNKLIPVDDTSVDTNGNVERIGLNPRARYAIHFHRAGTKTAPARVVSSAVVDSPGWGFVNHSSNVDMISNVAYNAFGAGFVTEAGDETGSFVDNLSVRNHGSDSPPNRRFHESDQSKNVDDFGHGGHGFWFQGSGITVRGNIASGSKGIGIVIWPIGIDGLGDRFRSVQVIEFSNNTVYGSDVGFLVAQHEDAGSEFVGTTIFGVRHGLEFFYPQGLTYKNTTIIGDLNNPVGTGVKMQHRAGPFQFFDTHVEGFQRGFETPRDGAGNVVDGVYLNNVENFALINGRRHFALELVIRGDVHFGTLAADVLADQTQYDFVLEESESAADIARYNHLVLPYHVTLDYNGLPSPYRVFFDAEQSPDHIVWPADAFENVTPHRSNSTTPIDLRGKTNAELRAEFELMTAAERVAMFSNENRRIYSDHPDAYYSFAGEIRPPDDELIFPANMKNAALLALLPAVDLVLNVDFNDSTATDVSPDNADNSGTPDAGMTLQDGVAILNGSGGIEFDGSPAIDKTVVQQRTVTVSFSAADVSTRQVLFEEGGASRGLNLYLDNGNLFVGAWDRPAGFDGTFLSTPVMPGELYSVTLVLDASGSMTPDALRGYLNGVQFASGSAMQISSHASGTAFGAVNGRTRFHDGASAKGFTFGFVGTLDNLRIYNRAIEEDEILNLFSLRLIDDIFAAFPDPGIV